MKHRKAVGGVMIWLGLASLVVVFWSAAHFMRSAFALASSDAQELDRLGMQTMLIDGMGIFGGILLIVGGAFLTRVPRGRR